MDDIIILTRTRSALRKAISLCHKIVERLRLKLSYAKTYVGKTTKEFTFLGYQLQGASMLEVAPQTIAKSLARVTLLLEQQVLTKERLEKHVQGFVNWAKGGLKGLIDVAKVRNALMTALNESGIWIGLEKQEYIKHKNRGYLCLRKYWCYRC